MIENYSVAMKILPRFMYLVIKKHCDVNSIPSTVENFLKVVCMKAGDFGSFGVEFLHAADNDSNLLTYFATCEASHWNDHFKNLLI